MKVIFVCTGNTCRSPLAESYAKTVHQSRDFESRGLMVVGDLVNPESLRIIEAEGLVAPSHPKQLSADDIQGSLLLTMTTQHKMHIQHLYPEANVKTLSEHTIGEVIDVADPYGGDSGVYDDVFKELKRYIDKL